MRSVTTNSPTPTTPAALLCGALFTLAAAGGLTFSTPSVAQESTAHPEKAVCTVCAGRSTHGTDPDPERVAGVSEHDGTYYYFCSDDCKAEFDASPGWWVPMPLPFPVPALEVRALDGGVEPLPIGDGKWTLLDFWATWCQPCKKTMRELQDRFEAGDEDLRIVGVSIDEGDGALRKVRRYVDKRGASYPIFLDDQSSPAWTALKIRAVPTMLLVDPDANVVWRYTGPDGDALLDELLERRGAVVD